MNRQQRIAYKKPWSHDTDDYETNIERVPGAPFWAGEKAYVGLSFNF